MDHGGHGGHEGSGGHGGHGGHGGGSMPMCSMNMLYNNQIEDVCVVFESWHISGRVSMFFSCLCIIAICVAYAALMARMRAYDRTVVARLAAAPGQVTPPGYSAVEASAVKGGVVRAPVGVRINRAAQYALTVGISYFLMLVAMTYNLYLCIALLIGAFIGHYIYEPEIDLGGGGSKGLACH